MINLLYGFDEWLIQITQIIVVGLIVINVTTWK